MYIVAVLAGIGVGFLFAWLWLSARVKALEEQGRRLAALEGIFPQNDRRSEEMEPAFCGSAWGL